MKKQPDFWKKNRSFISDALIPFGALYYIASQFKSFFCKSYKSKAKIICVGNATVGGAGKTPTAIALLKLVAPMGKKVAFLSKGYSGQVTGPLKVDLKKHTAVDVGDEPLLLAKHDMVVVAKNRVEGIKFLEKEGIEIIIMDDGLQNPSVLKDLSIMVVDGNYGFGNGRVMPSGPLREPVKAAVEKSDLVIFVGADEKKIKSMLDGAQIIHADIEALCKKPQESQKYVAFAGIANPNKFFNSLKSEGFNIYDKTEFADHYFYNDIDIAALKNFAKDVGAKLITTEKDIARISSSQQEGIEFLPIEIKWSSTKKILPILKEKLQ